MEVGTPLRKWPVAGGGGNIGRIRSRTASKPRQAFTLAKVGQELLKGFKQKSDML